MYRFLIIHETYKINSHDFIRRRCSTRNQPNCRRELTISNFITKFSESYRLFVRHNPLAPCAVKRPPVEIRSYPVQLCDIARSKRLRIFPAPFFQRSDKGVNRIPAVGFRDNRCCKTEQDCEKSQPHRSHSPNTTSIAPRMAVASGSMWPLDMKSIACRCEKAVGRILQR